MVNALSCANDGCFYCYIQLYMHMLVGIQLVNVDTEILQGKESNANHAKQTVCVIGFIEVALLILRN